MQRKHSAEFKTKIALEASKGLKIINEIASESETDPSQVTLGQKQLLEEIPPLFASNRGQKQKRREADSDALPANRLTQSGARLGEKNLALFSG